MLSGNKYYATAVGETCGTGPFLSLYFRSCPSSVASSSPLFYQYRVFSALALSYSIRWAGIYIKNYLDKTAKAINMGDESAAEELPEVHASLSGLKAWSTIIAHGHMEDLRKACGG